MVAISVLDRSDLLEVIVLNGNQCAHITDRPFHKGLHLRLRQVIVLGQLGNLEGRFGSCIIEEDAHTDATQLEEPQPQPVEPVQEEETAPASGGSPYHLVLITLLTIGLFVLTRILVAANVIKLATHRKIWNVVLLITALMLCLIGLFLVFQVNYNIKMEWFWTLKVLHVEFGIAMTIIAILHIFWHMNYWKTLFKGKKNQGKA